MTQPSTVTSKRTMPASASPDRRGSSRRHGRDHVGIDARLAGRAGSMSRVDRLGTIDGQAQACSLMRHRSVTAIARLAVADGRWRQPGGRRRWRRVRRAGRGRAADGRQCAARRPRAHARRGGSPQRLGLPVAVDQVGPQPRLRGTRACSSSQAMERQRRLDAAGLELGERARARGRWPRRGPGATTRTLASSGS